MPKTPSYRRRPGYTQAIVTLSDSATKGRRDAWFGHYGTCSFDVGGRSRHAMRDG